MASDTSSGTGIDPRSLSDVDLLRELESLHETRNATFRHGSDDALLAHNRRMRVLEEEYLSRFPAREVDPERLRVGARARD